MAERLGLTVQAASHSFRQLARRGLVEVRDGRYRPTVEGVAWLHESLRRLVDDVRGRVDRLHVIRSTRAVALADLRAGTTVSLEVEDGVLSARPAASGPSRGRVTRAARAGSLVEVEDLEGITPLEVAPVRVRTLSEPDLADPELSRRLAREVSGTKGFVGAQGLEAFHSLSRATQRPVARFGVAAASLEAARLGVPSLVVVRDRDLPQLLAAFAVANPPPLEVRPLASTRGSYPGRRRRRGR